MLLLVDIPDDKAKKFIRHAESNPKVHLKEVSDKLQMLIEEFEHISNARENAVLVRKGEMPTRSVHELLKEL
jgi:hypothetical protein